MSYGVQRIQLDGVEHDVAERESLRAALQHRDSLRADWKGHTAYFRVIDNDDPERGDLDWDAEELECLGHPAEDCGAAGLHDAIGDVRYCDGSCRS